MPSPDRNNNFALLGDDARQLVTPLNELVQVIKNYDNTYEIVRNGTKTWMRARELAAGADRRIMSSHLATVTSNCPDKLKLSAAINQYKVSKYAEQYQNQPLRLSYSQIEQAINNRPMETPNPFDWEFIARVLHRADPSDLLKVFEDLVAPLLFRCFPDGVVHVFVHEFDAETRFGLLRNFRIIQSFHVNAIKPDVPSSLMDWQNTNPASLFKMILDWASLLTFPIVNAMVLGQIGITILFIQDKLDEYEPGPFPCSILESKYTHSRFGDESRGVKFTTDAIFTTDTHFTGRYVWKVQTDGASDLLLWIADRADRFLRASSDFTNFERDIDNISQIDFVLPQEQLWTLDRVVRRTLQLQSAEARATSRIAVFEIADALAEIMKVWKGGNSVKYFYELFEPSAPVNLLKPCFDSIDEPWKSRFKTTCDKAYNAIAESIKNSVWATKKKSSTGVDLSTDSTKSNIEVWNEFIPRLIRDLRNTHHGYLPDRNNSRSRLILSTGDIDPAISFLPSLWMLALLGDPKKFLGWPGRSSGF